MSNKYDIYDRRNLTIHTAACQASIYYDGTDAITASTYHITELPYNVLNTYFEVTYQDRVFEALKVSYSDVDYVKYISAYATKKVGADLTKVLSDIKYDL